MAQQFLELDPIKFKSRPEAGKYRIYLDENTGNLVLVDSELNETPVGNNITIGDVQGLSDALNGKMANTNAAVAAAIAEDPAGIRDASSAAPKQSPNEKPQEFGAIWNNAGTAELATGIRRPTLDGMVGWWSVADRSTILNASAEQAGFDESVASITPLVGEITLSATGATLRSGTKNYIELSGTSSGLTGTSALGASFTVLIAAKRREFTSAAGFLGAGVSTLNFYEGGGGQSSTFGCRNGSAYDSLAVPVIAHQLPQAYGWRIGTGGKWGINKGIEKTLTGTAPTGTNLEVGYANGLAARSKLNVFEILVWNRALTDEEYDAAVEYLNRRWREEKIVVVEGDSIFTDAYSDSVSDGIAADPSWSNVPIYNYATSGDKSNEILADLQAQIWDIADADTKILILDGGVNDVNDSVASETYLGYMEQIYTEAKNRNWIIVGALNHYHGSWTAAQDALNRANNWALSQNGIADFMIPMNELFPSPHDPSKFVDGVHLTQSGVDDVVAWILNNALASYE